MKLFLRIFLSFWVATVLMIAMVLTVSELLPLSFPSDHNKRFEPETVIPALHAAVNAYETGGEPAFQAEIKNLPSVRPSSINLFDNLGNPLVTKGEEPPFYALMARDVSETGHTEVIRFGFRIMYACALESATGHRYAAVLVISPPLYRLANPRFWFNLAIAMIPAGFVCMGLALYLTRPITKLRAAARRLAGGELDARAGPLRFDRRDELGDLARDFDAMAAQIQVLMTAQRRFVVDVSHELGAPLTRMHLALALLRRHMSEKENGALLRIERETDKLSNLVQQLLLLAGLEAGRIPAETLVPISLQFLCGSIIDDANFEAAQVDCHVAGSQQEATFLAYPNLLRRAIDNVLRNAIRYAPPGTTVEVDCSVNRDEQTVTVEVLDRGPGVPESMLADIFRPFFRTAEGRETSSGGTGLGLAIASEAVHLHDGNIEAKNRLGGGLQVSITLPLKTSPPEHLGESASEVETLSD